MLTWLFVNMMRHFHLYRINNKHAPTNRIYVVERPMNDWMTDDILVLKALHRKYESLWRKTRLTVHFDMYSDSCMDVKWMELWGVFHSLLNP